MGTEASRFEMPEEGRTGQLQGAKELGIAESLGRRGKPQAPRRNGTVAKMGMRMSMTVEIVCSGLRFR